MLHRLSVVAAVTALAMCATAGRAQSPAFDAASVKVNNSPGRPNPSIQYTADTLTMRQVSLLMSLRWAYAADNLQISGPDSIPQPPFYDVIAKAPGPVPESQLRMMLRTLLAERFHLTVHVAKKEMPVVALLVAKGGPKFHESDEKYDPARGREMPLQFLGYGSDVHMQRNQAPGGHIQDSYTNMPMNLFADLLAMMGVGSPYDNVPIPVVDMTGLSGRYDLVVVRQFPEEGKGPRSVDDVLADLKPVLEKDLGLILEHRRATVDVLVVDHADKTPTDN